jgi:hypothetical protein
MPTNSTPAPAQAISTPTAQRRALACVGCGLQLPNDKNYICSICYKTHKSTFDSWKKTFVSNGVSAPTIAFPVPSGWVSPINPPKNKKTTNPLQTIMAPVKKASKVYDKCTGCGIDLCEFLDGCWDRNSKTSKMCYKCRKG